MNVAPGLISTIWWFIAVWLAWKSIEWLIELLFVRWTLTVSPRCTRRVGPGTWPPNVQVLTTKPSATVMSLSTIGKSTSWTVPSRSLGAVASKRVYLGAFGSATGAAKVPAATVPGVAAGAAPATMTSPFIPASAWPGIEHMKASPVAGTVTVPVALAPPSALIFVPSAKVTSWRVEPVFLNSTW